MEHFCLVLIVLSTIQSISGQTESFPIHECEFNKTSGICAFDDIRLTKTLVKYRPTVKNVKEVHLGGVFGVIGSRMDIFTSDICNAFPKVKKINADHLAISVLEDNSFENCHELEHLKMSYNRLTQLNNTNLFKNNLKLKIVHFYANRLTVINPDTFNHLTMLEDLSFGINNIYNFPIEDFSTNTHLKNLYVDQNDFNDINETIILKKFPKLTYIHICPNKDIKDERMVKILSFFKEKGIDTNGDKCNKTIYYDDI